MSDIFGSNKRQKNVIILLPLKTVNGCYFTWPANQRIVATTMSDDITNQMLLTIVSGQDGYFFCRIAKQSHVHEQAHAIFSLC